MAARSTTNKSAPCGFLLAKQISVTVTLLSVWKVLARCRSLALMFVGAVGLGAFRSLMHDTLAASDYVAGAMTRTDRKARVRSRRTHSKKVCASMHIGRLARRRRTAI